MRTCGGRQNHKGPTRIDRGKSKRAGIDLAYTALCARISCSRLLPRVRARERKREGGGRGERKREGGGRTSSSAWLLLCSSPPAGRPCHGVAPASLHLGSAASPRTSGMKSAYSSPCYRWPSARDVVICLPACPLGVSSVTRPHLPVCLVSVFAAPVLVP
jgi:hypothetical protein